MTRNVCKVSPQSIWVACPPISPRGVKKEHVMVSSNCLSGWVKSSRLHLNAFSFFSHFLFLAFLASSTSASATTVATPTFSPAAGTYTSTQTVTISDTTSGASIYYTTNGNTPTTASTHYSSPVSVSVTQTLKAIGTHSGDTNSAVGSAKYTIQVATPAFSPGAGTYTSAQTVTISDSTSGATVYYTTNGSTPTTSSAVYSSAITVSATETLKALATHSGDTNSAVGSAVYTIQVATPVFSPGEEGIYAPQSVTISDTTSGATIYYTVAYSETGTTPTTASTQYTGAFVVNPQAGSGDFGIVTLEAIAVHSGDTNSAVGTVDYQFVTPSPAFSPAAGTYTSAQTVTISDSLSGSTIYYTTNGTAPSTSSAVYSTPITVSASETLEAIADNVPGGWSVSYASTAAYTINLPGTAALWGWMGGSSSTVTGCSASPDCGQPGVYGTEGTFASGNIPGGRDSASSWTDNSGNLWLFGGEGIDANGDADGFVNLNDLWEFNPSTKEWAWMGGSSTVSSGGVAGVYGTEGTPAAGNIPGSRSWPATTRTDSSGNIWFFGGYGYGASGGISELNDLWKFNPSTKQWAWMSGSTTGNQSGVYGTEGTPASGNIPGGRDSAPGWIDSSGNIWLFGGEGYGSSSSWTVLNDLWKYSPSSNEWTWMGGNGTGDQSGTYGTLGTPASGNIPGSRTNPSSWMDSSGNLWLFGGWGYDSGGAVGWLNDLWKYNPSTNQWTWIAGSSTEGSKSGQPGVYGTLGTPAAGNIPGGRQSATNWTDSSGNFWLAGGWGFTAGDVQGYLNDVWEYIPSTNQWAWMGGSSSDNQSGVYGTLGTPASGNIPGGRTNPASLTDGSGNFWLFGGQGYDINGNFGELNDLWEYQPYAVTATPTFSPAAGTYSSAQTVTISDGTSGATIYYTTNGTTPTTSSSVYSSAIPVSASETLEALATHSGDSNSAVATAAYTINLSVAATPTFSPAAGTYSSAQTVTISDGTSGATIYYTTNGTTPTTSSTVYSSAITVSATETLEAIATASGYTQSAVGSAAYTITGTVATPTFSPVAGTYGPAQTVTISDGTSGATIYYTTNGTTPTTSSTVYSSAITVSSTETLEALATKAGYTNSAVGSAAYTINGPAATPTFSPAAGAYGPAQTVTISDSTSGATIYYTTNGSTPTTSSTVYSSAITVSATETLEAIATAPLYTQSAVGSAAYTINGAVATPTFSPAAGTYASAQTVTISDGTSGATIYYTTNGTTPTTSSSVYSSAITVSATETLEAIATKTGYSQSAVGSAAYTINGPAATPTFNPAAGTYSSAQTVTISDGTSGATIYYTTNGTTPTTSSTVYSSAITVSATETLEAIATASLYTQSAVGSAAYTINSGSATTETLLTTQTPVTLDATNTGTPGEQGMYFTSDVAGQINAIRFWKDSNETGTHTGNIWSSTGTLLASVAFTGETSSGWQQESLTTPYAIAANTTYVVSVNTNSAHVYTQYGMMSAVTNEDLSTISNSTINGSGYSGTAGTFPSTWWYGANYFRDVVFQPTGGLPAATPSFSPAQGTYSSTQTVTLSDATPGATIYYTTNGTTPTTGSTKYTGAITVSATEWETVQAVAVASGYRQSLMGSAGYTVGLSDAESLLTTQTPSSTGNLQTNYPNELGTVFTSDIAGEIRAIRFWKDIADVGTVDTGNIWNSSGTLLTSVVFNNETASGWQKQSLPTPLSIAANTQYVVSVNAGNSFDDTPGGMSATIVNQDLSSADLASGGSGYEGLLSNSPGTFPGYPSGGINYFRDVVFTPGSGSLPIAATPSISPAGGTYTTVQSVTISDSTPGSTIYYTIDGVGPSTFSPVYSGAINVSANETVMAIAAASGYAQSGEASQTYIINLPVAATPTFSPGAGTYSSAQTVTISDTTSGATIYYTTNGTQPSVYSTKYTGAFSVSTTQTVNAIAVATGYNQSATGSAIYNIGSTQAATPTFSPAAGTYTSQQTVTISDTTSGATIFYTLDGSTPTYPVTGTTQQYYAPFPDDATETVNAIATAPGYLDSNVGSRTYTINNPAGTCQGIDLGTSYGSNNASLNGFIPFPSTNTFNTNISNAAIDPNSATILAADAVSDALHPSFGTGVTGGYDYVVVDTTQTPAIQMDIYGYANNSDYVVTPIPANYPGDNFTPDCEGWPTAYIGDQIDLVLDRAQCWIYELYNAHRCNGVYYIENEVIWDMKNYNNRPWGWTSTSASGLAKFPLEVRYDEVAAGAINHALFFETPNTLGDSNGGYWVQPATHAASSNTTANLVTIGSRLRLKSSFSITGFSAVNQVILKALQEYGMIDVDNSGSSGQWFLDGVSNPNFSNDDLANLKAIGSSNFDIIQATPEFPGLDASSAYTSANPQYTGVLPVINSFTSTATSVSAGTAVTFDYSVSNDSYDYIDMIGPVRLTSGSGSVTIYPTTTQTYTLYSTSNEGQAVSTPITVKVTGSVVVPPVFAPPGGTYTDQPTVTISTPSSPYASIYFTTDGTTPTYPMTGTTQEYPAIQNWGAVPVNVSVSPTTLSAIAVVNGYAEPSTVSTATYYTGTGTTANTPTFTPPAGTYSTAQTVIISAFTPDTDGTGSTVYYTTDGTDPANSSTAVQYVVPIVVSATQTVRAIAEEPGYNNSAESSATYTIN